VNARNDAAKKAGRAARKAEEDRAESVRNQAELRERARIASRGKGGAGTGKSYQRGDR
jgi:hypothetical protein